MLARNCDWILSQEEQGRRTYVGRARFKVHPIDARALIRGGFAEYVFGPFSDTDGPHVVLTAKGRRLARENRARIARL